VITEAPVVRVAVVASVVATAAALLFPVYLALRAGGSMIFEPHPFDFALVVISVALITAAVQVVPWRAAPYIALLGALGAAGMLFGVLAMFSIGLAFFPAALVLLVLLARAVRRRPLSIARPAALGGALVGYGAVLLFIAQGVPATVECRQGGGGATSSGRWGSGSATMSASGRVGPGDVAAGRIETSTSIATYRCEAGRIVEFRREAR
jgi:hypothetical protein